jgi:hypothetical protein
MLHELDEVASTRSAGLQERGGVVSSCPGEGLRKRERQRETNRKGERCATCHTEFFAY